jgi:DNA-binding GntR family transcriptional regulator
LDLMIGKQPKLQKQTQLLLKDKAYQEIKQLILDEIYKPGQFLSEKLLIEELGMSKTPIKSALDRLETEGFISVWPKQGILVREMSVTMIKDIYELRMALELFVCKQLSGRLAPSDMERIEVNLRLQESYVEQNDEQNFTKTDAEFHLLLAELSANEEIHQIMLHYNAHLYRFALKIMRRVGGRMDSSLKDHQEIYLAMKEGRTDELLNQMEKHLVFGLNAHLQ